MGELEAAQARAALFEGIRKPVAVALGLAAAFIYWRSSHEAAEMFVRPSTNYLTVFFVFSLVWLASIVCLTFLAAHFAAKVAMLEAQDEELPEARVIRGTTGRD